MRRSQPSGPAVLFLFGRTLRGAVGAAGMDRGMEAARLLTVPSSRGRFQRGQELTASFVQAGRTEVHLTLCVRKTCFLLDADN